MFCFSFSFSFLFCFSFFFFFLFCLFCLVCVFFFCLALVKTHFGAWFPVACCSQITLFVRNKEMNFCNSDNCHNTNNNNKVDLVLSCAATFTAHNATSATGLTDCLSACLLRLVAGCCANICQSACLAPLRSEICFFLVGAPHFADWRAAAKAAAAAKTSSYIAIVCCCGGTKGNIRYTKPQAGKGVLDNAYENVVACNIFGVNIFTPYKKMV